MLADLAIGNRLARKDDGGRRPNAIRETPEEMGGGHAHETPRIGTEFQAT
jgi:hypothetical protein